MKITVERAKEIFEDDYESQNGAGDKALQGLNLIASKLPINKRALEGADHDIIYSIDIDKALDILEEEDFIMLARWNWIIDKDSDCLTHFV